MKGEPCKSCVHNVACRYTKKACYHFQGIDIRLQELIAE